MSIFTRIKDVVRANLNDLVDRMEDPDEAVRQLIQEMEAQIAECREQAGRAIATRRQLERHLEADRRRLAETSKETERALEKGQESVAHDLAARKIEAEAEIERIQRELSHAGSIAGEMQGLLGQLEDKVQEARRKREHLEARRRIATAEKGLTESHDQLTQSRRKLDDRMEGLGLRLGEIEAEAKAYDELLVERHGPLEELDREVMEDKIERQLNALRKKIAGKNNKKKKN